MWFWESTNWPVYVTSLWSDWLQTDLFANQPDTKVFVSFLKHHIHSKHSDKNAWYNLRKKIIYNQFLTTTKDNCKLHQVSNFKFKNQSAVFKLQLRCHFTLWIDFLCNLQSIGVSEVRICRSDCQYQAVLFADELQKHAANLDLDVGRLIANWHFRHARKINQRQVQHYNKPMPHQAIYQVTSYIGWHICILSPL